MKTKQLEPHLGEVGKTNIVLVGMPGSGKSTVGVVLAKLLKLDFVDTDVLIQMKESRTLQDIVDRDGYMVLRAIEERVLVGLDCTDHVIATGGSAVYSMAAMDHLKVSGIVVFLQVEITTLQKRVKDYSTRGLAKRPDQSFSDLFDERHALYSKYADYVVNCDGLTHEEACAAIIEKLN